MGPKRDVIDAVTELGGIMASESAQKLIEESLDSANLAKLGPIKNKAVLQKIAKAIVLCDPDNVFVNTASSEGTIIDEESELTGMLIVISVPISPKINKAEKVEDCIGKSTNMTQKLINSDENMGEVGFKKINSDGSSYDFYYKRKGVTLKSVKEQILKIYDLIKKFKGSKF